MRCQTWITLIPVTVGLTLQHLFHYSDVVGVFLPFFTLFLSAAPSSTAFYLLQPHRTAVPTHPLKTPESLKKAAPIGQPAPPPRTSLAPVLQVPPSRRHSFQQPWDNPSEKRRERPHLTVQSKRATLAWEPAVVEELSTRASRPAPPRALPYLGTTARGALGPALHAAPRSGKALGRSGRRRSHHRG